MSPVKFYTKDHTVERKWRENIRIDARHVRPFLDARAARVTSPIWGGFATVAYTYRYHYCAPRRPIQICPETHDRSIVALQQTISASLVINQFSRKAKSFFWESRSVDQPFAVVHLSKPYLCHLDLFPLWSVDRWCVSRRDNPWTIDEVGVVT